MKKNFFLFLFCSLAFISPAQQVLELMERTDLTLREVEIRANRYFDSAGTGRGTGYKQFQRWLYERKFHTDDNGYYIQPSSDWSQYQQSTQLKQFFRVLRDSIAADSDPQRSTLA